MSEILCPCCKRPMPDQTRPDFLTELEDLSPLDRLIVKSMADKYPSGLTITELVNSVYGNRWDGGPDTAHDIIRIRMLSVRKAVAKAGWIVPRQKSGRGRAGIYRLEKMEAAHHA